MIMLFVICVCLTLLLCLIIKLVKKNIPRRQNVFICVVVPILIVGIFVCGFLGSYTIRVHNEHILEHLLSSLKFSISGNRVFASENERLSYLDSLRLQIKEVKKIKEYDDLVSFCIGRNQDLSIRIEELQRILEEQHRRCERLNALLEKNVIYENELYCPSFFVVYAQNYKSLSIRNIAFKLNKNVDSIQAVNILIYRNNQVLFKQSYKYHVDLNAFVLPNLSSNSISLKIGVVTRVKGKNTLIYTKL